MIGGIDPEMIEPKPATDHPIPDDVMREAERIAEDIQDQNCAIPCDDCLKMSATIIARALLAERQRAAEIAKSVILDARMGDIDNDLRSIAHILEERILAQGEKS